MNLKENLLNSKKFLLLIAFLLIILFFVLMVVLSFSKKEKGEAFQCGQIFTDPRDNNTYETILIGSQCWMKENLAYLPSINGPDVEWNSTTEPRYSVYGYSDIDNSVEDAKNSFNYKTYGVLYNWPAAIISCPKGWRLPTDKDQYELENYLKNNDSSCDPERRGSWDCNSAGVKMKNSSWGGDNSSNFNALSSGHRAVDGSFYYIYSTFGFWSSSNISNSGGWSRILVSGYPDVRRVSSNKANGFSVRCIEH